MNSTILNGNRYLDSSNHPSPRVTVSLAGEPITCNTTQILRHAYGTQNYCHHLQEKYEWNDSVTDSIDWQIIGTAIQSFKGNQKRTIQKYINGWLPTQAHKSSGNSGDDQLCPCCRKTPETNQHFIQCTCDQRVMDQVDH